MTNIRAVHTSTLGAVWDQSFRGLELPCDCGQTGRQICIYQNGDSVFQTENSVRPIQQSYTRCIIPAPYVVHNTRTLKGNGPLALRFVCPTLSMRAASQRKAVLGTWRVHSLSSQTVTMPDSLRSKVVGRGLSADRLHAFAEAKQFAEVGGVSSLGNFS